MRLSRGLVLGASLLVLLSACSTGGNKASIKIGSDGFDEAKVMAEIYAQTLEANGYTVDRAGIGLGARKVTARVVGLPGECAGGTPFNLTRYPRTSIVD